MDFQEYAAAFSAREEKARWNRQQKYQQQKRALENNRTKGQPMTDARLTYIIDNAPKALAQLVRDYASQRRQISQDPYLPPAGQLHKLAATQDEYRRQHAQLADDVRTAIGVQRARLEAARDAKRPAVDQVTYDRKLRQIERLLSAGVSLQQLVNEAANDPVGLAVLAEEAPVLARTSGDAQDRDAGAGVVALIEKHGYDGAFGPDYRAAQDAINALDRKAAYVSNAIGQTARAIETDSNPMAVIDADGSVIDLDMDAA